MRVVKILRALPCRADVAGESLAIVLDRQLPRERIDVVGAPGLIERDPSSTARIPR